MSLYHSIPYFIDGLLIMLHPRMFMSEAMSLIETAKDKSHLLMSGDFPAPYKDLSIMERISMQAGFTNHPAFEKLDPFVNCYRLKSGFSASNALNELMTKYAMVVDCGLAQLLAYYLSILKVMQNIHGEMEGANRFDYFFGSERDDVPENRRLLLSPEGPMMGTHRMPYHPKLKRSFPLQPLSMFYALIEPNNKNEMLSQVKIGSMLMFSGDPDYLKVHPRGSKGGNNCVVSKLDPLRVRTFSHGYDDLSEEDLVSLHVKGYKEKPSDESTMCSFGENLLFQQSKPEPDLNKIIGFANYFVDYKEEELRFLLIAPLHRLDVAYQAYIELENIKIEKMQSNQQETLFLKAMAQLKIEKKNSTSIAPPQEPRVSYTPQATKVKEQSKPKAEPNKNEGPKTNAFGGFPSGFLKKGF